MNGGRLHFQQYQIAVVDEGGSEDDITILEGSYKFIRMCDAVLLCERFRLHLLAIRKLSQERFQNQKEQKHEHWIQIIGYLWRHMQ